MMLDTSLLPLITADLDGRIAPLVHALRRDGFATFASCDGHGNAKVTPWVQIEWPGSEMGAHNLRRLLLGWFSDRDACVNVSEVYGNYQDAKGVPARFIRVEVFDDLIREAFAW